MEGRRVLSLFSGIGGFDMAIKKPSKTYFSEVDPKSVSVFKRHFPEAVALGDVTKIDWKALKGIDLIVGGSPCTDVSSGAFLRSGGQVLGLQGSQSRLLSEFLRAIREFPRADFILENVSSMGKDNAAAFDALVKEAAGRRKVYRTEIDGANFTGVRRRRLFWTSWPVPDVGSCKSVKWQRSLLPVNNTSHLQHSAQAKEYMNRRVKGGRTHWDFGFHHDTDNQVAKTITAIMKLSAPYNVIIDRRSGKPVIRRLSPEEVESMMGFPKGWTKTGMDGEAISDTTRMKQLGNAVVPAVIHYILKSYSKTRPRPRPQRIGT
jgi:site-specific DNA-cytosine methylase